MLRGLTVVALVLVLAGCGSAEESAPEPAEAPGALTGTTLDGDTVSISDFRGTPVFVNVWSSW
jgi:hypothetical protein